MCFIKFIKSNLNQKTVSYAFKKIEKNNIAQLRQNTRIVLIDDQDSSLYQVLRERQYNIYFLKDMTYPVEAEPYQIILLDIIGVAERRESKMGGLSLAKDIKNTYPLKKVCCYSGTSSPELTTQLTDAHLDAFLNKGMDLDRLCDKLDKLIEDFANYELQWEVIRNELKKSNVADEDIDKIKKAYMSAFKSGDVSKINSVIFETIKNGTTILGLVNSILSLLKVIMVQ